MYSQDFFGDLAAKVAVKNCQGQEMGHKVPAATRLLEQK